MSTPRFTCLLIFPCCPCDAQRGASSVVISKQPLLTPSTSFFYPIENIRPCQNNASCLNIKDKYNKLIKKGSATWNGKSFDLSYNQGTSVYPRSKPFPVINTPYGFILINGTHRTIASISLGATTMPVVIVDDLSSLSREEFVKQASGKYIFPYDLCGNATKPLPSKFTQLTDNPNRYFSIISARTCKRKSTPNTKTTGSDYPLWIRVKTPDVGGFENQISQALWRAGLVYCNEYGDQIPDDFMEEARQILIDNPIDGLCLVRKRTYYKDIPGLCSKCVV